MYPLNAGWPRLSPGGPALRRRRPCCPKWSSCPQRQRYGLYRRCAPPAVAAAVNGPGADSGARPGGCPGCRRTLVPVRLAARQHGNPQWTVVPKVAANAPWPRTGARKDGRWQTKRFPCETPKSSEVGHRQDCKECCSRVMTCHVHTPATCCSRKCGVSRTPHSRNHGLHQHGVADQANREAFNFERLTGCHDDGGEVGIFGV